jgi:hypothetical protein
VREILGARKCEVDNAGEETSGHHWRRRRRGTEILGQSRSRAREVAERGREVEHGKLQARESLGADAGEEAGMGAGGIRGGGGTKDSGRRQSSLPNGFPVVSMRLGAREDAVPS